MFGFPLICVARSDCTALKKITFLVFDNVSECACLVALAGLSHSAVVTIYGRGRVYVDSTQNKYTRLYKVVYKQARIHPPVAYIWTFRK